MSQTDFQWLMDKLAAAKKKAVRAPAPPKPLEVKKVELKQAKQKDIELWRKWKDGGYKPQDLDPLLANLEPLIQRRASVWKSTEVPYSATVWEHKKEVVKALKTYDPSKGANLGTWVTSNMRHGGRFVQQNQNFTRLSENVIRKIGKFDSKKAELSEQLGYEPDTDTLHQHLMKDGYSKRDIIKLNTRGKAFIATGGDDNVMGTTIGSDQHEQVVRLILPVLTAEERSVHEYTYGLNGKPKLTPGEMAKKLGFSGPKVSKLRTSIQKKMDPYLRMQRG